MAAPTAMLVVRANRSQNGRTTRALRAVPAPIRPPAPTLGERSRGVLAPHWGGGALADQGPFHWGLLVACSVRPDVDRALTAEESLPTRRRMMSTSVRFGVLGVAVVTATVMAAPAAFADAAPRDDQAHHVSQSRVFVQNDSVSGNAVISYDRASDGTLTQGGTYPTGGVGGVLGGAEIDNTASQGAMTYDDGLLYVVNAGSNSVT